MSAPLVLASASPRRRALLARLGIPFDLQATGVPEDLPDLPVEQAALALALEKAQVAQARWPDRVVLAADTMVALAGAVLGKPADASEARAMLRALRGRWHQVVTAYAVQGPAGVVAAGFVCTRVLMRRYTDEEIAAYIASGDPFDKAGAYAIQAAHFMPVAAIDGCYYTVVGLPLCAVSAALSAAGLTPAPPACLHLRPGDAVPTNGLSLLAD